MYKTVHAVFDGQTLRPYGSLNLTPGAHYLVTIEEETPVVKETVWDVLGNLAGKIEGPKDWSEEHDHYLYGAPKHAKG